MRYIFSFLLAQLVCSPVYSKATKPVVVLLSIDGFSYEYLNKHQPPNIIALAKSGVLAKLQPVYPSKTFPNHLSIITGSYPANHGITNNKFYSTTLDQKYSLGAGKNNSTWLTADPFWFVAQQQKLKTAVYFWPESEIKGKTPTYNIPYNKKDSNSDRIEQIIDWLKLPLKQRPQFIASYFSSVDSAGHYYGPNSNELAKAVEEIDFLIGDFVTRLTKEIADEINIILVSDHGMLQKDITQIIKPSMIFDQATFDLIKAKAIIVARNDTQVYLYFTTSNKLERSKIIEKTIDKIEKNQKNTHLYQLYSKGNYPKYWQFDKNIEVIPDVILEALPPATFVKENHKIEFSNKGTHGYDAFNQKDLMGIFIASGPNIAKGKEASAFENIHVFPFMSELLAIKQPQTIDGKHEVLAPYLKNKLNNK